MRAGDGARARIGLAMLALGAWASGALAHDEGDRARKRRHDHEDARRALTVGEIRPLEQVLAELRATTPGDIVAIELEQKHGRWVYQFKVITADGTLRKLSIDARSPEKAAPQPTPVPGGHAPSQPAAPVPGAQPGGSR